MASNADIKRRMKSINSTMQITKAYKLVSAAKLRRAKDLVEKTNKYFAGLEMIIESAAAGVDEANKYIGSKDSLKPNALYIVVTADRGMAGGYNVNMVREVVRHAEETRLSKDEKISAILIGIKGKEVLLRAGIEVIDIYEKISENPTYQHAQDIADRVRKAFENVEYGRVYTGFTIFKSAIQQIPTITQLLPVVIEKKEETKGHQQIDFDPGINEVLDWALKKYIANMVYRSMVQSSASQQGARMTAMDSATDNANEMIDQLTLSYNRARQAAITQEISEIVGGANAIS